MPNPRPAGRVLPTSPFVRAPYVQPTTAGFSVGDRVTLDSRGMGRVLDVTEAYVIVDFGGGEKACVPAGTAGFARI